MLSLGLIGCGGWASGMHIPALAQLIKENRIKVVAVCDIKSELAEKAAAGIAVR